MTLVGRGADTAQALAQARACFPDGTAAQQRLLARHLAVIFAIDDTLERDRPLASPVEEQRTLLPWIEAPASFDGTRVFEARAPIRAALAQVERQLALSAGVDQTGPPDRAMAWWRQQGELMVAASWQEAQWRTSEVLPQERAYLPVAELSIGIRWIVASLLLLDGVRLTPTPHSPLMTATAAVAAAIRVANDLHDRERERREGKVQLLFLRSRALQARGQPTQLAEEQADRELRTLLSERVARAQALLEVHRWEATPRLRTALLSMLSTSLHMIDTPDRQPVRTLASAGQPGR